MFYVKKSKTFLILKTLLAISGKRSACLHHCAFTDFHATMDEDAISTVIFVGIGIGVLLVIVIIGAAVFVLCHQKIIRTRNMILPEKDHQHDYIKKILVSDVSSCNEEKKGDLSPYFHLDPTRNEYVWARRVMPDPSSSLVAISQNSLDWSRLEKKSSL